MRSLFCLLALLLCSAAFEHDAVFAQSHAESSKVSIAPDAIRINAFYKGTDVKVRADLAYGCDEAVVKIQGDDEEAVLKRKGKVSIFWLNLDEVAFDNAPEIYILNSSNSLDSICSIEERNKLILGYDALRERIGIHCKNALSGSEFSDFMKLKEHNGSYQQSATGQLLADANNKSTFTAVLHIPPVMPAGSYRVNLYCFKNRVLLEESHAVLSVEKVGVPKYLYSLAFGNPAAYGLLAIIIAMTTGIVMGLIFGSRTRRK
jgi:uncharacterized protein (TIGR02186 family)